MDTARRRRPTTPTQPIPPQTMREMFDAREESARLDALADELRTSARARTIARGVPVAMALDVFFAEQAGRIGSR